MTKEFLYKIAEKLGIPTAFAVVMGLALWAIASWTGNTIIEPLFKEGIAWIKAEQASMKAIAVQMEEQTDILKEMRDDQRKFPAVSGPE